MFNHRASNNLALLTNNMLMLGGGGGDTNTGSGDLSSAMGGGDQAGSSGMITTGTSNFIVDIGGGGIGGSIGAGGSTLTEFLYQITKMLTDCSNQDIIEWLTGTGHTHAHAAGRSGGSGGGSGSTNNGSQGRGQIEVHNPARLENEVLSRYFRHSKYSSFHSSVSLITLVLGRWQAREILVRVHMSMTNCQELMYTICCRCGGRRGHVNKTLLAVTAAVEVARMGVGQKVVG